MVFDPLSFLGETGISMASTLLSAKRARKARKEDIRREYTEESKAATLDTKSLLGDVYFKNVGGGVSEQTLSPTLNTLLQTNLENLRKRKEKEIKLVNKKL